MDEIKLTPQQTQILNALEKREYLSSREAVIDLAIGDPNKRISELRAKGFPIKDRTVKFRDEDGHIHRYKLFMLEKN